MKLIIGLGNPGEKYEKSRHNLGFMVLDKLLKKLKLKDSSWQSHKKTNSLLIKTKDLLLAKPQTFMNASGFAVKKIAAFYKIKPADIWIIHDEVDLPLGKIKIRQGGAAAGHRGVQSIIDQLGTDQFVRFRLGIGRPVKGTDRQVEKYVLQKFSLKEKIQLKHFAKKVVKAIELSLEKSIEKAMNRFNH